MQSNGMARLLRFGPRGGLVALAILFTSCGAPPTGGNNNNSNTGPPPDDTVRVTVTILGQGVVEQSANANMVTLTAVPDDGSMFSRWSGADVEPATNPITVDADAVSSITATFVLADDDDVIPARDDRDLDGVDDADDNCLFIANPGQVDTDGDGDGDVCDDCPVDADNDADGDAVCGDVDNCPGTANADQADADGDGVGDACEGDRDGDGTVDDNDNCPDTSNADQLNSDADSLGDACDNCPTMDNEDQADADDDDIGDVCEASGGGAPPGGGGSDPVCGNGIIETGESCDDGNTDPGDECDANCQIVGGFCGDGFAELLVEECDDGNTTPGDGCDADCMIERPRSDNCVDAIVVFEGDTEFSTVDAQTDGPDEPVACLFESGTTQVNNDIWFCFEATCRGTVVASLCGSSYDTKMAVYDGCDCPPAQAAINCSDDDCGAGTKDSRVEFSAIERDNYLIRIGGFLGATGEGILAIRCDAEPLCEVAEGDCFDGDTNDSPGCDDQDCCGATCSVDPFCCDVTWDPQCADEAAGLCSGSFTSCSPDSGVCNEENGGKGCNDEACCDAVCRIDPFCCVVVWDDFCAREAGQTCGLNCGTDGGFVRNNACTDVAIPGVDLPLPGCSDVVTCESVCAEAPECCLDEDEGWDQRCVCLADPAEACCAAVCAVDSFCCSPTGEWDDLCDQGAADLCE